LYQDGDNRLGKLLCREEGKKKERKGKKKLRWKLRRSRDGKM
jgi:hypothetical protein